MVSIGFEHKTNTTYKAITAFEVFEHLDNPEEKLKDMLTYTDNIVFSTELIPDQTPDKDWWYYAFSHGQHIAFYHKNSLLHLAQKNGLHHYQWRVASFRFYPNQILQNINACGYR